MKRDMLLLIFAFLSVVVNQYTSSTPNYCLTLCQENPRIRKNIYRASDQERQLFYQALNEELNEQGSIIQILEKVAEVKLEQEDATDLFWLRTYLITVQRRLQLKHNDVKLLYWDFSSEGSPQAKLKGQSKILNGKFLGGKEVDNCWRFKKIDRYSTDVSLNPDNNCIERIPFAEILNMLKIDTKTILKSKNFEEVNFHIRKLWPRKQNDIWIPFQLQDPLFLFYMTYLDKLYTDWQIHNPTKANYALNHSGTRLPDFGLPIKQIIDRTTRLCYSYEY
ncbi:hypothetical protein DSO57_1036890 [Entomophthora muscae]|uniref:Uncharacterized protein n=1 Tax=Entomophthora muscae TaxID=34485 RepID=A0ACC2TAH0_9FUNG|nr:hypothetical protein DSO57_1036890 [Entomophthora muscae]